MTVLLQGSVIELWNGSVLLCLQRGVSAVVLQSVIWPHQLKHLGLGADRALAAENMSWPPSLQHMEIEGCDIQSISLE